MKLTTRLGLGAVLWHHVAANEAAPSLPKVPKVFNAGPDGWPQLPDVGQLLKDYQDVKHHLDSEAGSFMEHLQEVEQAGLSNVATQKELYDKKLQEQEKENQALVRNNAHLAKEIIAARQDNAKVKKELGHEEKLMSFRQNQLRGLEQELARSQHFFQKVVEATNFEDEKGTTAAPTEDDMEMLEKDAVSFLEVSKKRHPARLRAPLPRLEPEPSELLGALQQQANSSETFSEDADARILRLTEDLRKLRQAEVQGRKVLQTSFQQSFAAGQQRQEALRKQEAILRQELDSTKALGQELKAKSKKLQDALEQMQHSLRKGGDFFGQLQKVAVAPVKDVESLLKAADSSGT